MCWSLSWVALSLSGARCCPRLPTFLCVQSNLRCGTQSRLPTSRRVALFVPFVLLWKLDVDVRSMFLLQCNTIPHSAGTRGRPILREPGAGHASANDNQPSSNPNPSIVLTICQYSACTPKNLYRIRYNKILLTTVLLIGRLPSYIGAFVKNIFFSQSLLSLLESKVNWER